MAHICKIYQVGGELYESPSIGKVYRCFLICADPPPPPDPWYYLGASASLSDAQHLISCGHQVSAMKECVGSGPRICLWREYGRMAIVITMVMTSIVL